MRHAPTTTMISKSSRLSCMRLALVTLTGAVMSLSLSCASLDAVRVQNRENLMRLTIGMTEADVLKVMGTDTIRATPRRYINHPFRVETYNKDGRLHRILFYYTDLKKESEGSVTDDELTPLVLSDGRLVGWGWSFLNENAIKYPVTYTYGR